MEGQELLNPNGVMCLIGIYTSKEISKDIGQLYTSLVLGNKTVFGSVNANRRYFEAGLSDLGLIENQFPGALKEMITTVVKPEDFMKAFNSGEEDIKSLINF